MTRIYNIVTSLSSIYDASKGSLDYSSPFELLIAVMLSAQCTDARVNLVTKNLFKVANSPYAFASMSISDIEKLISSISFYKNKAKHIKECSVSLIEKFDGIVPNKMNDLITLSGIGRKSANVIMLEAFGICEGIAVDTHALRISKRLGLSSFDDAVRVERDLLKKIPKKYWPSMNHLFVYHGRAVCTAKNPKCSDCVINKYCKYNEK